MPQAFHPPSELVGRAILKRRFTRTCSLRTAQPGDRPPAGGLLHRLLTLAVRFACAKADGGCFLLPYPTVANSFHFQKRSALCCPDFPLAASPPAADRDTVFQFSAKVVIKKEKRKLSGSKKQLTGNTVWLSARQKGQISSPGTQSAMAL